MDDVGWSKTRKGRVVYTKHLRLFTFKDLRRIALNMVRQDQISFAERLELSKILTPQKIKTDIPEGEDYDESLFEQIREYLFTRVFGASSLVRDLIFWLVDLEGAALKQALKDWLAKIN